MTDRRGERYGNYQLIRLLGDGNFGQVYSGEEVHDHTPVAVKILNISLTGEKELNEFLNEARMITLTHPHIVKLLDFGIQNGAPYLVMAYAPNGTLRDRHPEGTVLPLPTIISYVKPIAAALQYAHYRRIIHRDVKPENMLIGPHDEIWLSDFGIATTAHSTRSQVIQDKIGTVPYMAPEQIQGKPQPASDQYALAAVVYEWLSGIPPFSGDDITIALQHLTTPPPLLQTHIPTISPAVDQVVQQALAKDPQERFASVQEFANALEQVSQGGVSSATIYLSPSRVPIPPTVKVLTQVSNLPDVQLPSSQQPPSTTTTPPLKIGKPTQEQLYQAMRATTNPYAPWGKLILNDDTDKIWKEGEKVTQYYSPPMSWNPIRTKYEGEYFKMESAFSHSIREFAPLFYHQSVFRRLDVRDFAYQVHITFPKDAGQAGLLFRANKKTNTYYAVGATKRETIEAWISLGNTNSPIEEVGAEKDRNVFCTNIPLAKATPSFLLAVVVQGITIDIYLNLQHVKRLTSTALSQGTVGLFIGDTSICLFRHTRLWMK